MKSLWEISVPESAEQPQPSAMITPFWKTYKAQHPDSDGPRSSWNCGKQVFQENITETLRGVFIPEISMRIAPGSNSSIFMALQRCYSHSSQMCKQNKATTWLCGYEKREPRSASAPNTTYCSLLCGAEGALRGWHIPKQHPAIESAVFTQPHNSAPSVQLRSDLLHGITSDVGTCTRRRSSETLF